MAETMNLFSWEQMAPDDFARVVSLLGPRFLRIGDTYWGAVRTCFYRPLFPFRSLAPASVRRPRAAVLGGVQYPVADPAKANSHLNLLVFDQLREYSLEKLDRDRRRQIRVASREFVFRTLTDVATFKLEAHPIYLAFLARTGYSVGANRREPAHFASWADSLFQIPRVRIIGARADDRLVGVSVSYLMDHTVFYATFFCDDASVRRHLPGLMLHTVCASAAVSAGVEQVFVGGYKGNRGLDDFYLQRGARLVRQPARLEINPVTRFLLQKFLPGQYERLLGNLTNEQLAQAGVRPDNPD